MYENFSQEKVRLSILINMAYIVAFSAIMTTPLLEYTVSPSIYLIISFIWSIDSLFRLKIRFKDLLNPFSNGWLYVFMLQFIAYLVGLSTLSLNNYLGRIFIFVVPFMTLSVLKLYNFKEQRLLAFFICLIFVINLFQNIWLGFIFPEVFEYSNQLINGEDAMRMTNAGGTLFVCITVFFMSIFYMLFSNVYSITKKILFGILSLSCVYYLVAVNPRGTTFFVGLFMLTCFVFFKGLRQLTLTQKFFFVFVFIYSAYMLAMPVIIAIRDLIPIERLQQRINSVLLTLQGKDASDEGSLTARIELAKLSLNTFTSSIGNFLFGVGEHEYENGEVMKTGVGHHSQLIDCFAYFGIVGATFYYYAYIQTCKFISKIPFQQKVKEQAIIILVSMILFSFLNNFIEPASFIVLFLLFPLVINFLNYNSSK